jgi:hypothetical protein
MAPTVGRDLQKRRSVQRLPAFARDQEQHRTDSLGLVVEGSRGHVQGGHVRLLSVVVHRQTVLVVVGAVLDVLDLWPLNVC